MSKVFNMVGGGGGKNISSIIITGLSSTDTITCTKDGKIYTATWDETAQHWEIVGLPLGTFTVEATNGIKTTTETVLIDITGVYEIEMSYRLYLYKDGDPCEDVTGGWSQKSVSGKTDATVAMNETNISWYQTPGQLFRLSTNNPVDFTGYSKLVFQRSQTVEKSSSYDAVIIEGACSNPSATPITMGNEGTVAHKDPTLNTSFSTTDVEIDVSGVTGSYYVYIRSDQQDYTGLTISGVINKVWLE